MEENEELVAVPAEKQSRGPAGKGGLKPRCSDFFPDYPLLLN